MDLERTVLDAAKGPCRGKAGDLGACCGNFSQCAMINAIMARRFFIRGHGSLQSSGPGPIPWCPHLWSTQWSRSSQGLTN